MAVTELIKSVPAVQCEIPHTSKELYISGLYALNIQSPEGTTGDWHDVYHWREGIDKPKKIMLAGTGAETDTNPVFDDFGVYEGKSRLTQSGIKVNDDIERVYIANHFRAILDMLYHSLKEYGAVYNLSGATNDWLDTDEQKELVLSKAMLLTDLFSSKALIALRNWIANELKPDWRTA
jgi:hypothetical protein